MLPKYFRRASRCLGSWVTGVANRVARDDAPASSQDGMDVDHFARTMSWRLLR